MANECLVTTLKGTVQNNDLPFFKEIRIKVNSSVPAQYLEGVSNHIFVGTVNPLPEDITVMVVKGNGHFKISGDSGYERTEKTFSGAFAINLEPGKDYELVIISKDYVTEISNGINMGSANSDRYKIWGIDLSELDYASNLVKLGLGGSLTGYGEFAPKSNINKLEQIQIGRGDTYVDLDKFKNCTNINRLSLGGQFDNVNPNADISVLSGLINLVYFECISSAFYGEIDTLASRMAQNRTSGTLNIICYDGTHITDEGHNITMSYLISKGGHYNINITFDPSAPNGYTKSYT